MPVRLRRVVQPVLALVSVTPPPVDRQALPPCLVSLRTMVPVGNLFVGVFVSPEKLATVAVAVYAHRESKVTTVMMILVFMDGFLRVTFDRARRTTGATDLQASFGDPAAIPRCGVGPWLCATGFPRLCLFVW